jgi:hypothetical protein
VLARLANARALGQAEQWPLIDAVRKSPLVSARQQLLVLGAASVVALGMTFGTELSATTLKLAHGLDLPALAATDPQLVIPWADAVRLAGDVQLARETFDVALDHLSEPLLGLHAATEAAVMAVDAGEWDEVARLVDKAAHFMTGFVTTASAEATTVTVADTLADFRNVAQRIASAPRSGEEHDRLLSRVANLGSSLQLAVEIASGHLPVGGDLRAPHGERLQVLQWLDAGEVQVPLLAVVDDGGTIVHRGAPLPTGVAERLAVRIAGRVGRSLALEPGDVLEGVNAYRTFREHLASSLAGLPLDSSVPLTVALSSPLVGIPVHTALPEHDIAFAPSLSVAVALAHRRAAAAHTPDAVAEVRCWCYGDHERLIGDLTSGGGGVARDLPQACMPLLGRDGHRCHQGRGGRADPAIAVAQAQLSRRDRTDPCAVRPGVVGRRADASGAGRRARPAGVRQPLPVQLE